MGFSADFELSIARREMSLLSQENFMVISYFGVRNSYYFLIDLFLLLGAGCGRVVVLVGDMMDIAIALGL